MKKNVYFLALAAIFVLSTGCKRGYTILYAMGNQTEKEISILPSVAFYGDESIVLAPGEYYTIGHFSFGFNEPNISVFYENEPVYILMDGVKYQIDRNQSDNCLWERNYHDASEVLATSLCPNNDELVLVYNLTEDYIKRQIVVEE